MAVYPKRGEVWLVDFPDDPKSRPALIVSTNPRNYLHKSRLRRGSFAGNIDQALMREIEQCLLRAFGLL